MEHTEAIEMIRNAELSDDTKMDLYEMYLEDVEEYSMDTAIEKLEVGIRDAI